MNNPSGTPSANTFYDAAAVNRLRGGLYNKKNEILRTPLVSQIVKAVFPGNFPPKFIQITKEGIVAKTYNPESNSYHPVGVGVYVPDAPFDYEYAAALIMIFQDLYPNAYAMSQYSTDVLVLELNNGTWSISLTMKSGFEYKSLLPVFNIDNPPAPRTAQNQQAKPTDKNMVLAIASLILGALSFLGAWTGFPFLLGIAGIVTAAIALKKKVDQSYRPLAIVGLILSILGTLGSLIVIAVNVITFILYLLTPSYF